MDLRTELVSIQNLIQDPNNARKHSKRNIDAIKASLEQFGQRKPVIITEQNVIVAGNGTVQAAKELEWLEIVIVKTPADWTADQIQAYALADNRTAELADWDFEALASHLIDLDSTGFNMADLGFISDEQLVSFAQALEEDTTPFIAPEKYPLPFAFYADQREVILKAIEKAKKVGEADAPSALAHIARLYLQND